MDSRLRVDHPRLCVEHLNGVDNNPFGSKRLGPPPLGGDFRDIRRAVFGEGETRTIADFRRSGAQEAFAGDAKLGDVSLANQSLARSHEVWSS